MENGFSSASHAPTPWPLDPDETLLWEGKARPLRPRDGAGLLVSVSFLLFVIWRAVTLSSYSAILPGLFAAFWAFSFITSAYHRLRATRLRFAVTDRRVFCAASNGRIGSVPRENIASILPIGADAMACYPPLSPSSPVPAPLAYLWPLRSEDAPALHAALCRLLGLPPPPDAPPAHAFPPWMRPAERRRLSDAFPLPGDPILWVGRPAWRFAPWHVVISVIGVSILALCLYALVVTGTFRPLSLRALALGLLTTAFLLALAAFPLLFAALRRRIRYLVTLHGAYVLASRAVGKSVIWPRAALPAPRVVPHGRRRADLLFDTHPPFAFPSLPPDSIPAALSALSSPPVLYPSCLSSAVPPSCQH